MQDVTSEFLFHKHAASWTQVGDRVNGEFFKYKGPHNSKVSVTHLQHENGSIIWAPEEIRNIVTRFYSKLLTAEIGTEEIQECRCRVWDKTQPLISTEMNDRLLARMMESEVFEALQALSSSCYPG